MYVIGINTHVGYGHNDSRGLLMTEALKSRIDDLANKLLDQHKTST
jgi:hypothetical protein